MKISSLWNFARSSFPVFGILLLASCASTPKVDPNASTDPAIVLNVKSARSAYDAGTFERAAKFYELALARARALDDSGQIARSAYNAAACRLRANQAAEAEALLSEAGREFERSKMNTAKVRVLQSRAASALGHLSAAAAYAMKAMTEAANANDKVEATIALADVTLKQGDLAAAEQLIVSAKADSKSGHRGLRAAVAAAEGRFADANKDPLAAGKAFETAADLWRGVGNVNDMAGALRSAGDSFAKAGESGKAADLEYRAARSYFGQNDSVTALKCVEAAMTFAASAKDGELRDQITALFVQIKKSVDPAGESN